MNTSPIRRPLVMAGVLLLAAALSPADSRDDWQQPDRVVADFGLKPGSAIADIGCGHGYFTFRLAQAVGKDGKVFAEDVDAKGLKTVENRAKKEGLANIEIVQGDGTNTKLPDACADVVALVNVLHHAPKDQRPGLVKDAARALKAGGTFFLVDWRVEATIGQDRDKRIPRDDLLKLVTDAGLVLDAEFLYLEHQVFLRFRKATAPK